jgi:hypothetical protein
VINRRRNGVGHDIHFANPVVRDYPVDEKDAEQAFVSAGREILVALLRKRADGVCTS